ncbi:LOW QUALITY PROTEIN: maltase A3 [Bemisia tabaci]|uniref:LOW QUALITY PROTEIN: maltase A3 n=1 Tax=Bemisia tabaci TaxID=7038 RepID=UPI003B2805A3
MANIRYPLIALAQCILLHSISADTPLDWWQTSVIYQIYPRSFKDSNGDGIGDLNGIIQKADYLKDLGVGAIWISPFFKSPMIDNGYDISDFRAIEPTFGTMEDFIRLREAFHSRGIRIIMDFVPNHSSDEHEWFQKSVQNIAPYSDYYVWVDAKYVNGTRTPPSNWLSYFEGSAWTWNENRQKYYLHQYHPKQPDLNYRNPAVMKEMQEVLRFWLDLGVDGFRVDTVFTLVEDDRYLDEPRSYAEGLEPTNVDYLRHDYTRDQPGTYDLVYRYERLDEYQKSSNKSGGTRFVATEDYAPLDEKMRYYGNATHAGAHFPFNFLLITEVDRETNAFLFKEVIDSWYAKMPAGRWANWVIGNHDRPRAATRFGRDMLDSVHMIQFLLPGTVISYMGDEIGMQNPYIRWSETVDPPGINSGKRLFLIYSRDPQRAPFLWDDSVSAGFSTNRTTWLPVHPNYWDFNFEKQKKSAKSHHSVYKRLVRLKSVPTIQRGSLKIYAPSKNILVVERFLEPNSLFLGVVNVGSFYEAFDMTKLLRVPEIKLSVYASSMNSEYSDNEVVDVAAVKLRPKAGVVLTNQKIPS